MSRAHEDLSDETWSPAAIYPAARVSETGRLKKKGRQRLVAKRGSDETGKILSVKRSPFIEGAGRHQLTALLICYRGANPHALGAPAFAQADNFLLQNIPVVDKDGPVEQLDFQVSEHANHRSLGIATNRIEGSLHQWAEHFHGNNRLAPGRIRNALGCVPRGMVSRRPETGQNAYAPPRGSQLCRQFLPAQAEPVSRVLLAMPTSAPTLFEGDRDRWKRFPPASTHRFFGRPNAGDSSTLLWHLHKRLNLFTLNDNIFKVAADAVLLQPAYAENLYQQRLKLAIVRWLLYGCTAKPQLLCLAIVVD